MQYKVTEWEARYRQLEPAGAAVDYAGRSFEHFDLREFLELCLPQMQFAAQQPRALEYGTGTGPGACFLAARGFRVDAIDISTTAIEMARRFAAERNLTIDYRVSDIGTFAAPDATYDLVVDSFCLHRIISDGDRARAMANVHRLLKPGGYYLLGCAVFRADRDFAPEQLDPATGIVYADLPLDGSPFADAVLLGGRWVYARHRFATGGHLRGELEAAGFAVLSQPGGGGRILCRQATV